MGRKRHESIVVDATSPITMDLDTINNSRNIPKEFNEEYFNSLQSTLITFLDYAERDEELSEEEIKKERELFRWYKNGLKAGHLRGGTNNKLTSPDVFYILTTTITSETLAKKFGVEKHTIKNIRRGIQPGWEWEYLLVRKIMNLVRNRRLNLPRSTRRHVYILYKVDRKTFTREVMAITLGKNSIHRIRKEMIQAREFERFTKSGNLDIYYPIETMLISS